MYPTHSNAISIPWAQRMRRSSLDRKAE
jgi:hypothetical protein